MGKISIKNLNQGGIADSKYMGMENTSAAYTNQVSWGQVATLKSYDENGFILTWTKL